MAKEKVTLTLDAEKLAGLRALVGAKSLSASVDSAIAAHLARLQHLAAVDEWLAELERKRGPIPTETLDWRTIDALPVHTVLGPALNGPDSLSLKGLLLAVSKHIRLKQWDMGSEDFLGLVHRSELIKPSAPYTSAATEAARAAPPRH
jgi:hypothetical protein